MGRIYNNQNKFDYCSQTVLLDEYYTNINEKLSVIWGDNYIDLMECLNVKNNEFRVFDDNCKFLSQDSNHFTKAGAQFMSRKISFSQIKSILNK